MLEEHTIESAINGDTIGFLTDIALNFFTRFCVMNSNDIAVEVISYLDNGYYSLDTDVISQYACDTQQSDTPLSFNS